MRVGRLCRALAPGGPSTQAPAGIPWMPWDGWPPLCALTACFPLNPFFFQHLRHYLSPRSLSRVRLSCSARGSEAPTRQRCLCPQHIPCSTRPALPQLGTPRLSAQKLALTFPLNVVFPTFLLPCFLLQPSFADRRCLCCLPLSSRGGRDKPRVVSANG